jgi:OFA family oxalate/formate antiporter-like MFS transporter
MSNRPTMSGKVPRRGYIVLFAGLLSNFSVGILYTWSNVKDYLKALVNSNGDQLWSESALATPYSIGGMVFAALLIFAGSLQDRIGPRFVMLGGVIVVGLSTIASGFAVKSPSLMFLTFGVGVGAGLAAVYACPRPAAMKWFPAGKKGMINGIVVAGFGLGALWLGPLQLFLFKRTIGDSARDASGELLNTVAATATIASGMQTTFLIIGLLILAIGVPCSLSVTDPPAGYTPPEMIAAEGQELKETQKKSASVSVWTTMRTRQAWMLLGIYALYCSAGALVISNVTSILKEQSVGGVDGRYAAAIATLVPLMVPIVGLSNASGRASGGVISDFLGRKQTYIFMHIFAAANMLALSFYTSPTTILIGVIIACALYGAALSVTPSIVADYFGLKQYGANYGVVYYGWGLSLVIGPQITALVYSEARGYTLAYYWAIALLAVSLVLVLFLKKPTFKPEQILDEAPVVPSEPVTASAPASGVLGGATA